MSMFGSSKKQEPVINVVAKLAELRNQLSPEVNEMASDEDCHRFLTARKYDIPKTLDMINKWAVWWNAPLLDHKIDNKNLRPRDLLTQCSDDKEQFSTGSFLWSNTGEDKEGRPMYWEKTGLLAARYEPIKKNFTEDEMFLRHVRQQNCMVDRLEKASAKYGRPITKQTVVLDLKDLPFAPDMMGLKVLQRSIAVDEANYPERLDRLFVINAPIYFTAIWAVVRPWIDAVTVRKIQILGSNYQDTLREAIAMDQLPVEYGGSKTDLPWHHPQNNEGYHVHTSDVTTSVSEKADTHTAKTETTAEGEAVEESTKTV